MIPITQAQLKRAFVCVETAAFDLEKVRKAKASAARIAHLQKVYDEAVLKYNKLLGQYEFENGEDF